ncbi:MAG: glycoside hydrolase TIM-barrel-like domain-containing protein, partial [Rickettsiales bacterium]|nr:glycoside hydrolase TIM-barrel-like domain-containing protein [Rickettsiales bacterium]
MASIILSTAGATAGGAVGGPLGAYAGAKLGQYVGGKIDNSFASNGKLKGFEGPRLSDLAVQSSTYGKMIPMVYGTMRIAGNIIWSLPIKETATTTTSSASVGGKGGGGKVSQSATNYSYSVTLAVAICEGPVDEVMRVWADAQQLDLSQYTVRLYKGDEAQLPDSLIQSVEGAERTPAFRGMAYVVFEDFPMGDYGNRIPNFTFEVKKKAVQPDYNNETVEELVTGMVMIPGGGEFVYDTQVQSKIPGLSIGGGWVQQGNQQAINMHTPYGQANALVSLDQLKQTCPNVTWISVVVSWFGTSMDAGECEVLPGVEFQVGGITAPDDWQVAGYTRGTARQISLVDGSVQYGGTPDDGALVRYLEVLRTRGYKIALYPLMFMDVAGKPWRGNVTGSAANVSAFFTKTNGYNAFIAHYAALTAGKVDAFVIGSEMKGLTKVTDTPGNYPGVNGFVALASSVKATLGSSVVVTYAADWSEYHHTDGGWYNLDPLWASSAIDVIGIDAYFPLSNAPQGAYDVDALKNGWVSGEGYDWYYSNPERTVQASLSAANAWKNLGWFWNNAHVNPGGAATAWVPQSKKIWFTEYGFPSVDGAANQPNVFYSAGTSGSAFPYYSRGRVDFVAQRTAIMATLQQWKASAMVERMFLWTWDARPFPYWPDLLSVWSDGADWKTGHWVQGKLGASGLAAIVKDICLRAGLTASQVDVSRLKEQVEGLIVASPQSWRAVLEALQAAYFFDAVESGGQIKFVPRGSGALMQIEEAELAVKDDKGSPLLVSRMQEAELPKRVNVIFLSRIANYQTALQYAQRQVTESRDNVTMDLPIVCTDQMAKNIADRTLYTAWMGRMRYSFMVPVAFAQLEPADVVSVVAGEVVYRMRIVSTRLSTASLMEVQAVADDESIADFYGVPSEVSGFLAQNTPVAASVLHLLDAPAFPGDDADKGVMRAGAAGLARPWRGAALYRADDDTYFGRLADINTAMVSGTCVEALGEGPSTVFDRVNTLTVVVLGDGELQGVTEVAALNGANAALVGDEVIQFTGAALVEPGKYVISGLLRGRLGTEWATGGHVAGERFVLLDGRLQKLVMPLHLVGSERRYKAVS